MNPIELFQFEFIQRAFITGTIIAVLAPLIGVFLVVRRFSPLSDTLAHVSLVGIAAGLLSGFSPFILGTVASVLASFGIEKLRTGGKTYNESILTLFLSGSLGLATILIGLSRNINSNLYSFLFGSIATTSSADQIYFILAGLLIVCTVGIFYRQFFLVSFDEELAKISGLKVQLYNYLIIGLSAVVISLSIPVIGTLLISSLMVVPVITAMRFKLSFSNTLFLSILFSVISVWTGLFCSYYLDISPSGVISVLNVIFFSLSAVWNNLE